MKRRTPVCAAALAAAFLAAVVGCAGKEELLRRQEALDGMQERRRHREFPGHRPAILPLSGTLPPPDSEDGE